MALTRFKPLLTLLALMASANAFACSPYFDPDPVSQFMNQRLPGTVAFIGRVTAIHPIPGDPDDARSMIYFSVQEMLHGTYSASMPVRGRHKMSHGSDCAGAYNFTPQVGETWFVLGNINGAAVDPAMLAGFNVGDGRLSPAIRALINSPQPAGSPPRSYEELRE